MINYSSPPSDYRGWQDVDVLLASKESGFCVAIGEDPKSRPLLERFAAEVIASIEALVMEDKRYGIHEPEYAYAYVAVIVTTADLQLCEYDEETIDLAAGEFPTGSMQKVESLRFRKQLSGKPTDLPKVLRSSPSQRIATAKESTVFVVNVNGFKHFLRRFRIDGESLRHAVGL